MAISHLSPTGRGVFAGDDQQLGPIVAGQYPEPAPGEPVLNRSVFELARGGVPVAKLLENLRMNELLTACSAHLLYGPDYQCATPEVAARCLPFVPPRTLSPFAAARLDPAYPLVVVLLEGLRTPKANPVEADLVAELVTALRAGLRVENGRAYAEDEAFFADGLSS